MPNYLPDMFPCGHQNTGTIVPVGCNESCETCSQFFCETCAWSSDHSCTNCGESYVHGFVEQHRCSPDNVGGSVIDPIRSFYSDRFAWLAARRHREVQESGRMGNSRPWDEIAAEQRSGQASTAPVPPVPPAPPVGPPLTYNFTLPDEIAARMGQAASVRWHSVSTSTEAPAAGSVLDVELEELVGSPVVAVDPGDTVEPPLPEPRVIAAEINTQAQSAAANLHEWSTRLRDYNRWIN